MKKLAIICSLLLTISLSLSLQAQDPKAKAILDQVKKKYQAMDAFKAEFTYTISSKASNVNQTIKGEIYVKGQKFYLRLPEQHVITDGRTQWTYLAESNEVNVSEYEPDEGEITPDKIYSIYERDYKYAFVEEVNEDGRIYQIIDLTPKNREDSELFKIRLKIVKATSSIKSWELFEKNNNRYLYEITYFATVKAKDSYFKYNPKRYPDNPEVIDLR